METRSLVNKIASTIVGLSLLAMTGCKALDFKIYKSPMDDQSMYNRLEADKANKEANQIGHQRLYGTGHN